MYACSHTTQQWWWPIDYSAGSACKWQGTPDGSSISCWDAEMCNSDIIKLTLHVTSVCSQMCSITGHYRCFHRTSTAANQHQRKRKKRPCVIFTRTKRSTFTAWPTVCPYAPCARSLEPTKTARWLLSAASTRRRRWGPRCLQRLRILSAMVMCFLQFHHEVYRSIIIDLPQIWVCSHAVVSLPPRRSWVTGLPWWLVTTTGCRASLVS